MRLLLMAVLVLGAGTAWAEDEARVRCQMTTSEVIPNQRKEVLLTMPKVPGAQLTSNCQQVLGETAVLAVTVVPTGARDEGEVLNADDGAEQFAYVASRGTAEVTARETVTLLGREETLIRAHGDLLQKDADLLVARARAGAYNVLFLAAFPHEREGVLAEEFKRAFAGTAVFVDGLGELKAQAPSEMPEPKWMACHVSGLALQMPWLPGAKPLGPCGQKVGAAELRIWTSDTGGVTVLNEEDGAERFALEAADWRARRVAVERAEVLGSAQTVYVLRVDKKEERAPYRFGEVLVARARLGGDNVLIAASYPAEDAPRLRPLFRTLMTQLRVR